MTAPKVPAGLAEGGRDLWRKINSDHTLDAVQRVQLLEACRAKDRLDELDSIIHGQGVLHLMRFRLHERWGEDGDRTVSVEVKFDNVIATANATANMLKQLLAALRLPEEASGKRPQRRSARGAYQPRTGQPAGNVSSLDRARQRAGA